MSDTDTAKPKGMLKWALVAGVVVLVGIVYMLMPDGGDDISAGTTFVARTGDLQIKVLTSGTSEAIESQEIRSEIEGRDGAKILEIVEEGYIVTPEDVENNLVLVALDSAQIEDEVVNQEKSFESAQASYIESQAGYDIQLNQNKSDITAAELLSKFAKMDLQKYLGQTTVDALLSDLGLDERAEQLANAELEIVSIELPTAPKSAIEEIRPELADRRPRGERQGRGGEGGRRREGGGGFGGGAPGGGGGGAPGGGGFGGGGADDGPSLPLDDELIEAIAEAAAENGMPMEPERFKQMLRSRGGESPSMSMQMVERMKSMGLDVIAIADRLGKSTGQEAESEPPVVTSAPIQIDTEYLDKRASIDFSSYANPQTLEDGEAKQELNRLQDEYLVAQENLKLAESDLEATEKLVAQEFDTQTNLDRQRVGVQTNTIKVESAKVARELYIKYEFPKQVEQLLSDYEESLASLERTRAEAAAKLLQAEARLRSAEKDFLREGQQLEEAREQLSKCIITAERSGMVVYGTNERDFRGGSSEPIQEGTSVRERQLILTIPDMSEMAVTVKIHEASIKNVEKGQSARIVIDSHPNKVLTGEVVKVGVLPDSADRWMNPDIKQYNVQIRIQGTHEWLRPGMSAEVEVLVDDLKNVLYVPIQAINALGSERVCYVAKGNAAPERRVVETGAFNNDFIVIEGGLEPGEVVLLNTPADVSGDVGTGLDADFQDEEPGEEPPAEADAA